MTRKNVWNGEDASLARVSFSLFGGGGGLSFVVWWHCNWPTYGLNFGYQCLVFGYYVYPSQKHHKPRTPVGTVFC